MAPPAASRPRGESKRHAMVGVVSKPFGLQGEVYVRPDPDIGFAFEAGARVVCDDQTSLVIADSWMHRGRRIVAFEGVDDRGAAEGLRGRTLTVPREELPVEADTFWADELIGRPVRDRAGEAVGTVQGIRDGHAHDYLVVARTEGGEVLLPAVAELVTITDDDVVVEPLPGLLE